MPSISQKPIHPCPAGSHGGYTAGVTYREHLAALCLQGLLAAGLSLERSPQELAGLALAQADELVRQLDSEGRRRRLPLPLPPRATGEPDSSEYTAG